MEGALLSKEGKLSFLRWIPNAAKKKLLGKDSTVHYSLTQDSKIDSLN